MTCSKSGQQIFVFRAAFKTFTLVCLFLSRYVIIPTNDSLNKNVCFDNFLLKVCPCFSNTCPFQSFVKVSQVWSQSVWVLSVNGTVSTVYYILCSVVWLWLWSTNIGYMYKIKSDLVYRKFLYFLKWRNANWLAFLIKTWLKPTCLHSSISKNSKIPFNMVV